MGGYAGIHEKFSIYSDGRVTNAAGQTQQISAQTLEGIRRRIEALDVPKSCDIHVSGAPCSDCFQYRIVLIGPSGRRMQLDFAAFLRLGNGKIAEMWLTWDNAAALAQLGHLPPAPSEST